MNQNFKENVVQNISYTNVEQQTFRNSSSSMKERKRERKISKNRFEKSPRHGHIKNSCKLCKVFGIKTKQENDEIPLTIKNDSGHERKIIEQN